MKITFKDVVLAWGDHAFFHTTDYLLKLIVQFQSRMEDFELKFFSIGETRNGNPSDFSQRSFKNLLQLPEESKLKPFSFKPYAKKIRIRLNMGPSIVTGSHNYNRDL